MTSIPHCMRPSAYLEGVCTSFDCPKGKEERGNYSENVTCSYLYI